MFGSLLTLFDVFLKDGSHFVTHDESGIVKEKGIPNTKLAWETFAKMGIDFINTDKPSECVAFLKQ